MGKISLAGKVSLAGYDSPADVIVSGYFDDPMIAAELSGMLDSAELMGIDLDDSEIMGAWLKDMVGKIKSKIAARKKGGGQAPALSLTTGAGTANISSSGVTWVDPAKQSTEVATESTTDKIKGMLKNPMVLAGLAAIPVVVIMMRRKKRKGGRK